MSDRPSHPLTPASGNRQSYRDAGVDIDAGNALVERIKPLAAATARSGCDAALGGFGAIFDLAATGYRDPLLIAATDGVGTKLLVAGAAERHDTVGVDLVAMCVNDLIVQGAEPLFFLDYFATGALDVDAAAEVIAGIAAGCREAGCALIGGESAELPGLYRPGDYDLAGFAIGAVERDRLITGADVAPGDVVLGLASSGLHSNGFSLVRKIVESDGLQFNRPAPFDTSVSLAEALLRPTRIYVKSVRAALPLGVKALAHITGGGLIENLPRVLPAGVSAAIDANGWRPQPVFDWLQGGGRVAAEEMLRTFNCGIGMAVVVAAENADAVSAQLTESGENVSRIGEIAASTDGTAEARIEHADSAWGW